MPRRKALLQFRKRRLRVGHAHIVQCDHGIFRQERGVRFEIPDDPGFRVIRVDVKMIDAQALIGENPRRVHSQHWQMNNVRFPEREIVFERVPAAGRPGASERQFREIGVDQICRRWLEA